MGRTRLMTYTIRRARTGDFISEWKVKEYGKPTPENLSKWRDKFNQSLKPGGANAHIGMVGYIQYKLQIYNQKTKSVVCEFNPPMFETID